MPVIATAGHVDHGKSTLVKALTGMEPDRWAEEQRREMTIDLGYVWVTLPSGVVLSFVDVPGHSRFIGNMLAGLGPSPAVMLVVAADEGWRQQTAEHVAAIDALGIENGLVVVTRSDLADPGPTIADVGARLAHTSLRNAPALAVSARTGQGLDELKLALDALVTQLPAPETSGRWRMWLDRAFTITGAGTVVTGTLARGSLAVGDELALITPGLDEPARVRVRGLQSLGRATEKAAPVARVAVNLRGYGRAVQPDEAPRGTVLAPVGRWRVTAQIDARLRRTDTDSPLPTHAVLHVGTASVPVRIRPLGDHDAVRLSLEEALPIEAGDRAILRDPGAQHIVAGVLVVDAEPPELRRRGAARERGAQVAQAQGAVDIAAEVARRGSMTLADLAGLGVEDPQKSASELLEQGDLHLVEDLLVADATWRSWEHALTKAVTDHERANPMDPWMPMGAAADAVGVVRRSLVPAIARAAGLVAEGGRVHRVGVVASLGAAEVGMTALEQRLRERPWAAPEKPDLDQLGLGHREISTAVRAGRLLRLPSDQGDVLLAPTAPAQAMRVLAGLEQPFTTSQARQALDTTRRVVIPLLEHLDAKGWTERLDAGHRRVRR